jgi:hypothetical protein
LERLSITSVCAFKISVKISFLSCEEPTFAAKLSQMSLDVTPAHEAPTAPLDMRNARRSTLILVAQSTSALLQPSLAAVLVLPPRCLTSLIALKMSLEEMLVRAVESADPPNTAEAAALAASTTPLMSSRIF